MSGLWLTVPITAPWLVAIAWAWSRAPRLDWVPPSMGELARQRLETL